MVSLVTVTIPGSSQDAHTDRGGRSVCASRDDPGIVTVTRESMAEGVGVSDYPGIESLYFNHTLTRMQWSVHSLSGIV